MSKYFSKTFRVRWSEVNANGQVDLAGYLRYAIETAWDWGAANGLSMAESEEFGLAWVIRETEINYYRPLYPGDIFDLKIWLVKWRRVRGSRCFELRLKDGGDLIAQGVQQVVTLDGKTMRPTPPPETIIANFQVEKPRVFPHQPLPKFQTQPETAFKIIREVEWRDLDSQEHVNNATYAAYAENVITQAMAAVGWSPDHFKTQGLALLNRRFHIQYLSPATWGDTLDIAAYLMEMKSSGGTWYIEIKPASDGEPLILCVIEWVLVNRLSGEEQALPESLFNSLKKFVAVSQKKKAS